MFSSLKKCNGCGRCLPADPQYFHRDTGRPDGFASMCKECKSQRHGFKFVKPTRDGHKRCRRCDQEYPKTSEHFHKAQDRKDGFYPYCKGCVREMQIADKPRLAQKKAIEKEKRRRESKEGHKICAQCKNEYPCTTDFFYKTSKNKSGFTSWCKKCTNDKTAQYRNTKLPDTGRQEETRIAEPYKTCACCKKSLRRTSEFFYKDKSRRDGLGSTCAECVKQNTKEWAESNPDKRRIMARIITERRLARKRNLPDTLTLSQWERCLTYFDRRCAACGRSLDGLFHTANADHFIALSSPECPGTVADNIIPLCGGLDGCNNSKHAKPAAEWLAEKLGPKKAAIILDKISTYFAWVRTQDA